MAHGIHTYYEVGIFTQRAALGYDLIADELSPEDKVLIAEAFWKESIRPTLDDYFAINRLPISVSNHEAHSVSGAIELAWRSVAISLIGIRGSARPWRNSS